MHLPHMSTFLQRAETCTAQYFALLLDHSGEAEAGAEDSGLLGQFVDYIIARKMVPLEEVGEQQSACVL